MKCGELLVWFNLWIITALIALYIALRAKKNDTEGFAAPATRPCAVYFTRNPEACDDPRGLFAMSDAALIAARDAAPRNSAERQKYEDLYNERQRGEAKAVCKLTFAGLVEPTDSPYKSAMISADRGPPEHWAYCYNQTPVSYDEADRAKLAFGDKGTMAADSVLTDNSVRVNFKTLDFKPIRDTYCQMKPSQVTGVNVNNVLVFNVKDNLIDSVQVSDITSDEIKPSPAANQVYLRMFERRRAGNQLVLAPRRDITGKVMVLYVDVCAGVFKKSETPITFTITGGTPIVLATGIPSWVGQDLIGQYATLVDQLAAKKRDAAAATANTTKLTQGLIRTQYSWSHLSNWQPLNNKTDVDNLISRAVYTGRDIDRIIYYTSSDVPHYYIRIWEGHLQIDKTDKYEFRISTDDAGELFVDNSLVASHYGYHGADAGGLTIGSWNYSRGTVPVKIRLVEQWGGHGINYIQWRRKGDYTWRTIQTKKFLYSTSVFNRDKLRLEADELQERVTALEPYYKIMTGESSTLMDKLATAVQNLRGKQLSSAFTGANISFENKYYVVLDGVDTSLRANPNWDQTERQDIITTPAINIAASSRVYTDQPIIDYSKSPVYTVAFWLWIDSGRTSWRNVLILGENWGSRGADRNPGIYIYPDNTTRIHFRQNSTRDGNDGQDLYNNYPAFKTWFHFAAVVTSNTIQLYLNGAPREFLRLPGNHTFTWSAATARKKNLYINYYRQTGGRDDGEMRLARLVWANRAFTAAEVADLARESVF